MYRHAATGAVSEEPSLCGAHWASSLLPRLPMLAAPGLMRGRVIWAAQLVHWSPANTAAGEKEDGDGQGRCQGSSQGGGDNEHPSICSTSTSSTSTSASGRRNPLLAGAWCHDAGAGISPDAWALRCAETATVFDVVTSSADGDDDGAMGGELVTLRQVAVLAGGAGSVSRSLTPPSCVRLRPCFCGRSVRLPVSRAFLCACLFSALLGATRQLYALTRTSSARCALILQLTLGSWRGVNQFVETEADVCRPTGDALDAW